MKQLYCQPFPYKTNNTLEIDNLDNILVCDIDKFYP